mmetsp:Transcript_4590/g.9855  ORF Transcript_4590/g.9855 Transcript_4590/m.9855 type:complete len:90 (+) Transcript_4590:17-286(+)
MSTERVGELVLLAFCRRFVGIFHQGLQPARENLGFRPGLIGMATSCSSMDFSAHWKCVATAANNRTQQRWCGVLRLEGSCCAYADAHNP